MDSEKSKKVRETYKRIKKGESFSGVPADYSSKERKTYLLMRADDYASKRDYMKALESLKESVHEVSLFQVAQGSTGEEKIRRLYEPIRKRVSRVMKKASKEGDSHPSDFKKIEFYGEKLIKGMDERIEHEIDMRQKVVKESERIVSGLEKKTLAIIGGFGIVASMFFLSPVVTGNAIGSIGEMTSGILGGALFVLGVGGIFISCRRK